MNLSELRKMQTGCGFKHAPKKKSATKVYHANPKAVNIKAVIDQIKLTPATLKYDIIKNTELSEPCVRACIVILLESMRIAREYIGQAGPHAMYSYSVK